MSEPLENPERFNRRDALVLAGMLLCLLLLFAPVLVQDARMCLGRPDGDARDQFYGWRAYGFGQIRQGHFPLWNPYEFLGMPFVANLQSAMFYPLNWLCAFLPIGLGVNLGLLLNLFLSAVFTYLWTRRLRLVLPACVIAAAAYALGAPQFLRIFEGHWSFMAMMPWIPLLMLAVELIAGAKDRRALAGVLLGSLAVSMQWFGGNPQYAFYGGIGAWLYFVCRLIPRRSEGALWKPIAAFVAMYALGTLMACAQLLPAIEFLGLSSRQGQLDYDWVRQYSLEPEFLLTLLSPGVFGDSVAMRWWGRWNPWEMTMYVGIVTLGLTAFSFLSRKRALVVTAGVLAAAMLLLAFGGNTPLLKLLYRTVPGFDLFRAQARFLCPFSLFLALLAALGVDTLLRKPEADAEPRAARRTRVVLWCTGGAAGFVGLVGLLLLSGSPVGQALWKRFMDVMLGFEYGRMFKPAEVITEAFTAQAMQTAGMSLLRSALFLAALVGVVIAIQRSRLRARWAGVLLCGLVFVDLFTWSRPYLVTFDPGKDALTPETLAVLKKGGPVRYARGRDYELPECEGMTNEVGCIEGIQPNAPARFRDAFWFFQGDKRDKQRTIYSLARYTPPLRMLNLRYTVQRVDRPPPVRGMGTVHVDPPRREGDVRPRLRVDRIPGAMPRAWMVHRQVLASNVDDALAHLRDRLDYANEVLLEEAVSADALGSPGQRKADITFTAYEPNRVALDVDAPTTGVLVMSDLHFPGWSATIDGTRTNVLRANYLMRAVAVPKGEHRIEFTYRPASFVRGKWLSIAGLLVWIGIVILHRHVRRRARSHD